MIGATVGTGEGFVDGGLLLGPPLGLLLGANVVGDSVGESVGAYLVLLSTIEVAMVLLHTVYPVQLPFTSSIVASMQACLPTQLDPFTSPIVA